MGVRRGEQTRPQQLVVTVQDSGPGIDNLDLILSGGYRSTTGMGLGILAAHRLMEQCDIRTGPAGTSITVSKPVPASAARLTPAAIGNFMAQLDALPNNAALSEAQQQNRELTAALSALQARQDELLIVSARLEETNRRVEALNVMLDEKADALQRADRSKDEFLAILSHELRGPLSATGIAAQLLHAGPAYAGAHRADERGDHPPGRPHDAPGGRLARRLACQPRPGADRQGAARTWST